MAMNNLIWMSRKVLGVDSKEKKHRISFITDIEGDGDYFDRFIEKSKILAFEPVEPVLSCSNDEFKREPKRESSTCSISSSSSFVNDYVEGKDNPHHDENYYTVWDYFPYDKHVVFVDDENNDKDTINILVCGGDMWDKGGSDLYVTRQLLSLQTRYGAERVHFILGNRDINKLRILEELGFSDDDIPFHPGVYWLRQKQEMGDPEAIEKSYATLPSRHQRRFSDTWPDAKNYAYARVPADSVIRLKWMLEKTMGSPDAFELRRGELKRERKFIAKLSSAPNAYEKIIVTDEDVVDSYRTSCHPIDGVMGEFIRRGKLAYKIGSVMFLHGALPVGQNMIYSYKVAKADELNDERTDERDGGKSYKKAERRAERRAEFWRKFLFDAMPWRSEKTKAESRVETAQEWADALNSFSRCQVKVWETMFGHATETPPDHEIWAASGGYKEGTKDGGKREFGSLIQYGMDWLPYNNGKNPSAVYSTWFSSGLPRKFYGKSTDDRCYADIVDSFFETNNLSLIVTGHQPIGDMPFPIQVGKRGQVKRKFIIAADNSYSANAKWVTTDKSRASLGRGKALSFRGDVAVSEVLIDIDYDEVSNVYYHGVLSDGSPYESINLMHKYDMHASLIGKRVDQTKFQIEGTEDGSYKDLDWFVKAKTNNGSFLVSSARGRDVYNSIAWSNDGKLKKEEDDAIASEPIIWKIELAFKLFLTSLFILMSWDVMILFDKLGVP